MSNYHNDKPIQGNEKDPDLLNRKPFAEHLANVLILDPSNDCLTVSLEGEWGYGKTSVMNLIRTSLKEKDAPPIIIEYNPWLAGNAESLIQDFLIQFSSSLSITHNSEVALEASKELIAYSSLFNVAKLVPGVEPWASMAEKVFSIFGNSTKQVAELKKLDTLEKKNKVQKALEKINVPIIVFIDDIDRLTPNETFQVLRLVKAVADFPGTTFLLAFDPSYLSKALEKHNINNASEYIDKIIQLRVPLPVISDRDMYSLSEMQLDNLSDKDLTLKFEQDQERLGWSYHKYIRQLIKNPRELKRFYNHLRFVLEQIEGQVCFNDLFCLSAIAIKANNVYAHIKSRPEAYIGRNLYHNNTSYEEPKKIVEKLKDEREKVLQTLSSTTKEYIRQILIDLFPLLKEDQYHGYPYLSNYGDDELGRIAAAQRLHIALHYATPTGYISDYEILSFINGTIEQKEFVLKTLLEDSTDRFFEMINNYAKECKNKEFEILSSIYNTHIFSAELKEALQKTHQMFSSNNFNKMIWTSHKLISTAENKKVLLDQIIKNEDFLPVSIDLLDYIKSQISEVKEKGHTDITPWVSEEDLIALEKEYSVIAEKTLTNKHFSKTNFEPDIFYGLRRTSESKASALLKKLISENNILRICEIIGRSGNDSSNGRYVHITEERYKDIIDFPSLQEQAQSILNTETDLPTYIKATLSSITTGKKYYLDDCTEGKIR